MRPRWSRPAQVLLDAGESIEEQLALLERAHCLSARARAERSTVAALLDQITRAHDDAVSAGGPAPEAGGPWLCDAVRDVLRASGYLDELAWATLESGASPENPRVRWIVEQVRGSRALSVRDARPSATPAAAMGEESPVATPTAVTAPTPSAPADPVSAAITSMTCGLCQRKLPTGAAFCGYCGHKLS
jgi:hypothetical protein